MTTLEGTKGAAFRAMSNEGMAERRRQVLFALVIGGPNSVPGVSGRYGVNGYGWSSRFTELAEHGLIEQNGHIVNPKTKRRVQRWIATEKGRTMVFGWQAAGTTPPRPRLPSTSANADERLAALAKAAEAQPKGTPDRYEAENRLWKAVRLAQGVPA